MNASQSSLALIGFVSHHGGLGDRRAPDARMTHYRRVPVVGLMIAVVAIGVLALDPAGVSLSASLRAAHARRRRARPDVSGHHGGDPERGLAPSHPAPATPARSTSSVSSAAPSSWRCSARS